MRQIATIIFLALFFTSFNFQAQSNYDDYAYSDKEDLFYDSFNNNNNYWLVGDKTYGTGKIESGDYYWTAKSSSAATTTQYVKLDTDRDFQIEARFKRASGTKENTLQSLLWGCTSSKKNYFGFTADGSYRISWYDGSKYHAYKDWTSSSSLNKTSYNRLTIRKVGNRMHFFINQTRVYSMSFKSFFGNEIGFQAPRTNSLRISFIRVSYLKKRKNSYASYTSKNKTTFFDEEFDDNSRDWSMGSSGKSSGDISSGYYTWKSKHKTSAWSTQKTIKIDQDKDFEIQARLKYLDGKTTSGIMLEWGKSSSGDNFNFEFNANGKYWIGKYEGEYVKSKGWTASSSINKTSFNKLTIRKIGEKYYFFINQEYVHSMPFKKFYGDKVSFTAPAKSSIKIDYLTLSYLGEEEVKNENFRKGNNEENSTGGY
jgi:hypothetical protein